MTRQVWFTSSFFRVEPGEDEETNPGRYGKTLAHWVSERLRERGVPVEGVVPEDFGWVVMVSRRPFLLWVGCGNEDGSEDRWTLFAAAEPGLLRRMFRRVDPRPAVARLEEHLAHIVADIPDARNVVWEP